jgi:energy-converting hydrogenase B subunit D
MIMVLLAVIGTVMITAAVLAVHLRNLLGAIIAAGVVSLFASIVFLLLGAPDVAMTEAAIGAGLSTVIFLFALRRTTGKDRDE